MKTKLTSNGIYLLFIDEEAEIKGTVCLCYNSIKNTWDEDIILYQGTIPDYHFIGFQKIIAYYPLTKEAKELDLPLLPNPFKEKIDINEIAKQRAIDRKWHPDSMETRRVGNEIVEAVKYGYQIAQSKQFSLEDMKKAIEMARTLVEGKNEFEVENILGSSDGTYGISERYTEEEIIQSLSTQQLPKEFKPIMVCGRCLKPDDNDEDCWSAKECSRNTDFPDTFKTIANSEGKEKLIGTYKY